VTRRRLDLTLVAVLALGGCSGKSAAQPPDANPDAAIDAPGEDCVRMQQAYVSGLLAPAPQTDVALTVGAVLGTADFHRAMPYCSGDRPTPAGGTRSNPRPR